MTQQQQLTLLNDIMPDIIKTRDPESVMLKCAKANNLSPAQLERLGQVFNAAKTLHWMDKSANRGDFTTLVDVPNLVQKYTTYDPGEKLTHKQEDVHEDVNKLVKSASATPIKEGDKLPNLWAEAWSPDSSWNGAADIPMEESSSAFDKSFKDVIRKEAAAENNMEEVQQILYELGEDKMEKLAELKRHLAAIGPHAWPEAYQDITFSMGHDKEACLMRDYLDEQLRNMGLDIDESQVKKASWFRVFHEDRHNVIPFVEELLEYENLTKEAAAAARSSREAMIREGAGLDNEGKVIEVIPATASRAVKQRAIAAETARRAAQINALSAVDKHKAEKLRKLYEEFDKIFAGQYEGLKTPVGEITADVIREMRGSAVDLAKGTGDMAKNLVTGMREGFDATWDNHKSVKDLYKGSQGLLNAIRPKENKEQKLYDKTMQQADAQRVLLQLSLSDPVIREADQNTVNEIYNTIYSINPEVATDLTQIKPILREAIQYDAVPIHLIKGLADARNVSLKNKGAEMDVDRNLYRM